MSIKTNNSFPEIKKDIRSERPTPLMLIDCFAGNQMLWGGY